jgi:hypothetical protein
MPPPDFADVVRRFAEGPAALRAAWEKVPAEARQWRPAPGKWSAHEVVGHCGDSQAVAHARLRYFLCEKAPLVVGYDQDLWAAKIDYHAHSAETALAVVEACHANTVSVLRGLTDADLAKAGHHTEYGTRTVEEWVRYNAEHMHVHAKQIERNVAAWNAARAERA